MTKRHPLQDRAIRLRNETTDTERFLWRYLKGGQIEEVKFRRQIPIENYIVDFVSFERKLIVELDGGQHVEASTYDDKRDACLRRNGFTVLRFWNNEVLENTEGVLEVIREHCLPILHECARRNISPPLAGGDERGGGSFLG